MLNFIGMGEIREVRREEGVGLGRVGVVFIFLLLLRIFEKMGGGRMGEENGSV